MTDALNHRLPKDIDAERALLGSLLQDIVRLDDVQPILRAGDDEFADERNRIVYACLLEYRRDHESSADAVMLKPYAEKRGRWEAIGKYDYLGALLNSVPYAGRAIYYAGRVHEKYLERSLVGVAVRIMDRARSDNLTCDEKIDMAASEVLALVERGISTDPTSVADVMMEAMQFIADKAMIGTPTGWHEYDTTTGGLQRGEYTVVAARPGQGKSAFLHNLADHLAVVEKKRVVLFSVEMGRRAVMLRLLSGRSEIPVPVLRQHKDLSEAQQFNLTSAKDALESSSLIIDDQPDIRIGEIRAKCRTLHRKQALDAILVDYAQLVRPDHRNKVREQEVSEVSHGLQALAKSLNVPVVAAAQLRRALAGQDQKRPTLDSLRESGSLEQDADVVVMIHRPRITESDGGVPVEKENPVAEILIRKNRNGETVNFKLGWHGDRTTFTEQRPVQAVVEAEPPAREFWP
jgi:replicative DNA helicase